MSKSKSTKTVLLSWLILILSLVVIFIVISLRIRPVVISVAKAETNNRLTSVIDKTVIKTLNDSDIKYNDIAVVRMDENKTVKDIEIDIVSLNYIKSVISSEISNALNHDNISEFKIPLGSLLLSDYLSGYGPLIPFKIRLAEHSTVNFDNCFTSVGINQVLHQILIKIKTKTNLLMFGKNDGFSIETTEILAQTVIVGTVPDNFTNVIEDQNNKTADRIFNYGSGR